LISLTILISYLTVANKTSGIMSKVTTILAALGISICSCVVSWSSLRNFVENVNLFHFCQSSSSYNGIICVHKSGRNW